MKSSRHITIYSILGSLPFISKLHLKSIKEAADKNISIVAFGGRSIEADREFILEVVRQQGTALEYASAELKADREVVLAAVSDNGLALKYAGEFQNDREVVLAAVRMNGGVLEHVSAEFKNDREVVRAAVSQLETNPECIQCIQNPRRQQLYDLISPLSIVSFHCGEALAQYKLTGLITGLMTLSYHSPLRASVGSDERPHSREGFNWNHDVSLSTLRYLSVKDIVRLMRTPANVYVKASNRSERPCGLKIPCMNVPM